MPEKKLPARSILEWLAAVITAVLLFFFIRNFVIRVANVTGSSMEPTLNHGDYVILSRFSYIFSEPEPGDIVAFPYRGNPSEHYIKRVIGRPGDIIDLRDYRFVINGEPLDDGFSFEEIVALGDVMFPLTVPEGQYFMLGDNRNGSKDSRYSSVGCVPKKEMLGKVALRVLPIGRFGTVR